MKKKVILSIMAVTLVTCSLTGCSKLKSEMKSAMTDNQEIKLSVDGTVNTDTKAITWGELDQLTTYKDIRDIWDDTLQIIKFDYGSKNGVLFVDLQGNWAGNNTLYNAFQNKEFSNTFWDDGKVISKLAEPAMTEFRDLPTEDTAIYGAINAYFNILPANSDGTSGLMNNLSRAQAMAAIYRSDTPVSFNEENQAFREAVGASQYNTYAQEVSDISYLKYENKGLNYDTYNSPCTRAEAIYMIVQRYFKDDYDNVDIKSVTFSDCTNAGNILKKLGVDETAHAVESYELEWCLQNPDDGCPEELYKALVVARNKGLLASSETSWNSPIRFGDLLSLLVKTYRYGQDGHTGYLVNAKTGANAGKDIFVAQEEVDTDIGGDVSLGGGQVTNVRDITDLNDLLAVYGNEIDMTDDELSEASNNASKFTFEAVDKFMMVDFCSSLNVRTGPTTDYRILGSVPKGTKVHVVAFCKETGWYRIIANKKVVYQCEVYFSEFEGADQMLKESEANSNASAFDQQKEQERFELEQSQMQKDTDSDTTNPYTEDEIAEILETDLVEYEVSDVFTDDTSDVFDRTNIKLTGTVSEINNINGVFIVTLSDEEANNSIKCHIENSDLIIDVSELEVDSIISISGIGYEDNNGIKLFGCYAIDK